MQSRILDYRSTQQDREWDNRTQIELGINVNLARTISLREANDDLAHLVLCYALHVMVR